MRTEKALIQQQMSKIDELRNENNILRDYIKQYKEKEDKLREYLTNTEFEERTAYDTSFCEGVYNTKEKAFKILNEGKNNE